MGVVADAIGSVAGGIGNVVGSVFGGVQKGAGKYAPKTTFDPKTYSFDPSQYQVGRTDYTQDLSQGRSDLNKQNQFRDAQLSLIQNMQARADGRGGPSVAELQLQQSQEQNLAGLQSALASQKNLNPAMAARTFANQYSQAQGQLAQNAALLRAQEQQQAQQALSQNLAQGRQGDLQSSQIGNQLTQFYKQLGFQENQAQLMANMELQRQKQAENARTENQRYGVATGNTAEAAKFGGATIGALSGLGAAALS